MAIMKNSSNCTINCKLHFTAQRQTSATNMEHTSPKQRQWFFITVSDHYLLLNIAKYSQQSSSYLLSFIRRNCYGYKADYLNVKAQVSIDPGKNWCGRTPVLLRIWRAAVGRSDSGSPFQQLFARIVLVNQNFNET